MIKLIIMKQKNPRHTRLYFLYCNTLNKLNKTQAIELNYFTA